MGERFVPNEPGNVVEYGAGGELLPNSPEKSAQLEALFTQLDAPLRRHLRRLTGNAHDAEDLYNELFLKLWRSTTTVDAARNPFALMCAAATNLWQDKHHRLGSSRAAALEVGFEDLVPADTDSLAEDFRPELATKETQLEEVRFKELWSRVKGRIDTLLRPEDGQILTMRYVEDLQFDEIAQRLNLPIGTVKSRFHRGKTELTAWWERSKFSVE